MVKRIYPPKTIKLLSMAIPALVAGHLYAGNADMDYVQLSFVNADYAPLPDPLIGYELEASKSIDKQFFVFGTFHTTEEDFDSVTVEMSGFSLGGGFLRRVDDKVDLVARFQYIDESLDSDFADADESGFGVSFTAHYAATEEVEVIGGMLLDDVENSDATFNVGVMYKFPQNISAVGTLSDGDDGTFLRIGARYAF